MRGARPDSVWPGYLPQHRIDGFDGPVAGLRVDPDGDVHINEEFRVHPDRMLDRERRRSLPTAARTTSSALAVCP